MYTVAVPGPKRKSWLHGLAGKDVKPIGNFLVSGGRLTLAEGHRYGSQTVGKSTWSSSIV